MSATDILICSLPAGIINRPPAAPALLKACVEQAGFSCRTQDLSLDLYVNHCNKNFELYQKINRVFEPTTQFNMFPELSEWLDQCIKTFKLISPRFIGLSVFSAHQHRATVMLAEVIRQHLPNTKIIVGGYGLYQDLFAEKLKQQNLADYYIFDEGENKLVNILQGQPIDDTPVDLQDLPVPNFDNYQLDNYLWHNEPVLTITGSKGCVRSCTFCNVPGKFGRYRRRTGSHIAQEIIELQHRYGVNKFEFTDSLVNGSQRDFIELIECLSAHNKNQPNPVTWYGQYICRPQSQVKPGTHQLLKESGCINLIIGAESGSDDILAAMNKKQTVKDIMAELNQFELHGLQAQLLMLCGFYNETEKRFLETLKFIAGLQRYIAAGVVTKICMGFPLMIEQDEYLHQHADELGIVIDPNNISNWKVRDDPQNTWLERLRRRMIVQAVLDRMNMPLNGNSILELHTMLDQIKSYEQQLRSPDTKINTRVNNIQPH